MLESGDSYGTNWFWLIIHLLDDAKCEVQYAISFKRHDDHYNYVLCSRTFYATFADGRLFMRVHFAFEASCIIYLFLAAKWANSVICFVCVPCANEQVCFMYGIEGIEQSEYINVRGRAQRIVNERPFGSLYCCIIVKSRLRMHKFSYVRLSCSTDG